MTIEEDAYNRYRIYDVSVTLLGKEKALVQTGQSQKAIIFDHSELQLLLSCQQFDTLDSHAEKYCRQYKEKILTNKDGLIAGLYRWLMSNKLLEDIKLPVGKKEMEYCQQQLRKWVDEGFLVSESELKQKVKCLSDQKYQNISNSDNISVIGIPTCGRPKTLKRCLTSFIGNFIQNNRNPNILILDDSPKESDQKQNQAVLKGLIKKYNGNLFYMNRQQRFNFGQKIAQMANVDPDVVKFALMGHHSCNRTEGGCRNAFLLFTHGQLALQTDDDTICQISQPPTFNNNTELILTSKSSSDDYWFFQSYEEAINKVSFSNKDFLAIHEQMLGKSLDNLISSFLKNGNELNIEKLQPSFFRNMNSVDRKIKMSLVGPVGDTCLFSDLYRLFLKNTSLERLIYPKEAYSWHLSTRQVIRSVTQPTISDFTRCIGMNFALDNRSLLPPFMPVQARCDGIFGDLLKVCFHGAFAGNLPFLLKHNPPEKRSRNVDEVFTMLEQIRVNDIVAELIHTFKEWPTSKGSKNNLRTLGSYMINLANLTKDEFEEKVRRIYVSSNAKRIQIAEQYLSQNLNGNPHWAKDMERYIKVLRDSVVDFNFLVPDDIDNPSSNNNEDFKEIILKFGELLYNWSDIYKAMDNFNHDEKLKYITRLDKC